MCGRRVAGPIIKENALVSDQGIFFWDKKREISLIRT